MKLLVKSAEQVAELWDGEKAIRRYVVSTALNGLGCTEGSYCTPTGKLRVSQRIGEGLALGAVLRGRIATGEIWSSDPLNPLSKSQEDLTLTRILWLEGCEAANANTLQRYVYLHGTNQEHLLGKAASHGCIRLSNRDIVELFDLLPVGAEVEVV